MNCSASARSSYSSLSAPSSLICSGSGRYLMSCSSIPVVRCSASTSRILRRISLYGVFRDPSNIAVKPCQKWTSQNNIYMQIIHFFFFFIFFSLVCVQNKTLIVLYNDELFVHQHQKVHVHVYRNEDKNTSESILTEIHGRFGIQHSEILDLFTFLFICYLNLSILFHS